MFQLFTLIKRRVKDIKTISSYINKLNEMKRGSTSALMKQLISQYYRDVSKIKREERSRHQNEDSLLEEIGYF